MQTEQQLLVAEFDHYRIQANSGRLKRIVDSTQFDRFALY
jgi:hypothetical protein